MLRISVLKRRDGFTLNADFQAPTPGVVALFGRSGCGKTTLVNLLSGLLQPDEGAISLDDTVLTDVRSNIHVPVEQRRIGYVFQDSRLFPHYDVHGNLRYGLIRALRRSPTSNEIGFDEIVELLGIQHLLSRRPHQLSGGERQRVALGRALLSQPRLLLLDEPLANLDVARREEVLPYLEALRDRLSIPMVYVSHQFDEVIRLATHVVLLDAGTVTAQGTLTEVSLLPQLRAIVGADAAGAVIDGVVTRIDTSHGLAEVQLGQGILRVLLRDISVGTGVRVQLLARDVILATEPPHAVSLRNSLRGIITELTNDGPDAVLITVDIGGAIVLARVTQHAVSDLHLYAGLTVWALIKAASIRSHAFTDRGSIMAAEVPEN